MSANGEESRRSTARYGRRRARRSGGAPFVVVMQTADVWELDDRAQVRRLNGTRDGSVLVEREVRAPLVIVREVALQVAVGTVKKSIEASWAT